MPWSLRRRILLALAPLLLLLAVLGGAALVLLYRVGGRIDAILRENYDSIRAMERLGEAVERIDSSFQFALLGKEKEARDAYDTNWKRFDEQFAIEEKNITILPDEELMVDKLRTLKDRYRRQGTAFYEPGAARRDAYFGAGGLLATFDEVKAVAGEILRLNHDSLEKASADASALARRSLVGFGLALVAAGSLAAWLAWRLVGAILGPIGQLTTAAQAIGAGNLDRAVPVSGPGELAGLATAFNAMTGQLRDYRRSRSARLVRAQRTAQATIDSFSDPVVVIDPAGAVELANPAAQQLLGVSSRGDAEEGTPWVPPSLLQRPVAEALAHGRPFLTDSFSQIVLFQVEGQERAYLPQARPIRDPHGGGLGAALVLADVTRFRLLDRLKSDLAATASHELKTPLTSIRLAVHVLLEEAIGPLTDKQTEILLDARENTERLLQMIDSFLTLARLERGSGMNLQRCSPAGLLRKASDTAASRAEDRHVGIVVAAGDELPAVLADPVRLGQALNNLVDNALAYTPPGGTVTLSATAADGQVTMSVRDTGAGIPPEWLPKVFTPFFRVPGQAQDGTGLGLNIVQETVQAHGGEVSCESAKGEGTTFRIALPVAEAER